MKLKFMCIGLTLIILGWLSVGYMGYLIHYDLITAHSLISCVLVFFICLFSGFLILAIDKDMHNSDAEDNKDEKLNPIYSIISTVFWCSVCFVFAFSLVYLGAILDDKPDRISYGGGGGMSSMGSSDSEIVFYQSDDGWIMIVPDNYGEDEVNQSLYFTCRWNGTAWIFEEEE